MEIYTENLQWTDSYKLLIGAIVPRPIAFVSTISKEGINNAAAFSFFNGICPKPFMVSFAPMYRPGDMGKKDTLRNIEDTGSYVINLVSEDLVPKMNMTAPDYPEEVDEFEVSGLTPLPGTVGVAPRIAESKIQMECKLHQILSFGDKPGAGSLVIGEVLVMHVHEDIYDAGKIRLEAFQPVARLAGNFYARTTDMFELERPKMSP